MVRSTEGLQTSVGRSLQGTFRPYRATWHRRHKDEDPRPSCKVRLDRMVNVGRISAAGIQSFTRCRCYRAFAGNPGLPRGQIRAKPGPFQAIPRAILEAR
jgi:hypothetical protein